MKILIVGSGGREHALGFKVKENKDVEKIFFAPGNGGTSLIGENVNINVSDLDGLLKFAKANNIDLTIVGPELPLTLGIVDLFRKNNLLIFGADKKSAKLEESKSFSKYFMEKYEIPTAKYKKFTNSSEALASLKQFEIPLVIKADGLCAGKGVIICESYEEAEKTILSLMDDKVFGDSGETIVIEEFLYGKEASLICFIDNDTILPMVCAKDYKRAFDNDEGLNTGGMGSVSPVNYYIEKQGEEIARKTLVGIQKEGFDYRGVIYIGLMLTKDGAKVLEYNVRFGDPETEALLIRLQSDLTQIIKNTIDNNLKNTIINWKKEASVCVVLASDGYPEKYQTDFNVKVETDDDVFVFHCGTKNEAGVIKTCGGRVLAVCALSDTIKKAREQVYKNIDKIKFSNKFFRNDIGSDLDD